MVELVLRSRCDYGVVSHIYKYALVELYVDIHKWVSCISLKVGELRLWNALSFKAVEH